MKASGSRVIRQLKDETRPPTNHQPTARYCMSPHKYRMFRDATAGVKENYSPVVVPDTKMVVYM